MKVALGRIIASHHFYLALYFAQSLARDSSDSALQNFFKGIAEELSENEERIHQEYLSAQGAKVDLGGYYKLDDDKCDAIMRPSATFNAILAKIK